MEQHVFIYQWHGTMDGEVLENIVRVFSNYDDAKKVFDLNFADDIKDAKERGWVLDTHDDTDWYEFYEDGYYVSNHFESRIDRVKVETL